MSHRLGGTSQVKDATEEVQKISDEVRAEVETQLGQQFATFSAKSYSSQVVAGTNYFIKVHIGEGVFLHLRVYEDLNGKLSLRGLQENKTEFDAIAYF